VHTTNVSYSYKLSTEKSFEDPIWVIISRISDRQQKRKIQNRDKRTNDDI